MNIFLTDLNPYRAVYDLCEEHLTKMPLETMQIISTVLNLRYEFSIEGLYKPTHKHHPSTIWAGDSSKNMMWLLKYASELFKRFYVERGKYHGSQHVLDNIKKQCYEHTDLNTWLNSEQGTIDFFYLAMPVDIKSKYCDASTHPLSGTEIWSADSYSAVLAYREYINTKVFKTGKRPTFKTVPYWYSPT